MPRQPIVWSPNQRDATSVANSRVCLALLRIFREVRLGIHAHSHDDLVRPLWPAIRLERRALQTALKSSQAKLAGPRASMPPELRSAMLDEPDAEAPHWLAQLTASRGQLPMEAPDAEPLRLIGSALVHDRLHYRGLFDAVEKRLECRAAQALPLDRNIEWLSALLGLSALEQQVLTLCAALDLGSIEREGFAHVGRAVRRVQALGVALQLNDPHALAELVGRQGALQRSGLLRSTERTDNDLDDLLRLSRIGSMLTTTEFDSVEAMAACVLKPLPAPGSALAWPHLAARTALLQEVLGRAMHRGETGINILVYGPPGTGKSEYARQLVQRCGALGFDIDDTDGRQRAASRDERLGSLRMSEIFAPAGRSVLVLDEAEDIFQSDYGSPLRRAMGQREESKSWMNQRLECNRIPVIWISNQIDHIDPAYLRRFTYCLELPVPPRAQRREIAHAHLSAVGASARLVDRVAAHPTLPAALLASAARFANLSGAAPAQIDDALEQMLTDHLQAMQQPFQAPVVDASTRFDLAYLHVNGRMQPGAMVAGLARLGRGSVLLSGPPGTGKTQLASQVARALGRELLYRTAADINSKWYGESERNVAALFEQCDPRGEVLFLDEAETLLGDRSATGHRADRAVTAEFLRRVESFDGVFICATNHADAFDPALMRRFVFRLELLPLAAGQREALFTECLQAAGETAAHALQPAQRARLQRLDRLTPGDFAIVAKRFASLGIQADAGQWLDELDSEHQTKPGAARSGIGFV